jgi:major outer membrane protein
LSFSINKQNGDKMKKLLTVITGLVAGSALYAMPVLNPAAPALETDGVFLCDNNDCWGLKAGYRGDFVYNRHVRDGSGSVDRFGFYANEGVLTLNLWDRVDVYGFVGAAAFEVEGTRAGFEAGVASPVRFNGISKTRTIWGGGIKATVWECGWGSCGTTYLGADLQYEAVSRASFPNATLDGDTVSDTSPGYRYQEVQFAVGLAHRVCMFVPYVAVKWSKARQRVGSSSTVGNITTGGDFGTILSNGTSHRHWGYVVGLTIVDAGRISVTGEARFIDETAATVSADFRF